MKKVLSILFSCLLMAVLFQSCGDAYGDNDYDSSDSSSGKVVINEVEPFNNKIEIFNPSSSSVDVSGFFFCANRTTNQYVQLNSSTIGIDSGSLDISPGGFLVLDVTSSVIGAELVIAGSGLGLYSSNSFGSSSAVVDYVKYGTGAASGREDIAVSAGLWSTGDLVDTTGMSSPGSVRRNTNGSGTGVSAWGSSSTNSLGSSN